MANPSNGRWALISDGDPDKLRRFFCGCMEQGCETRGVVITPNGMVPGGVRLPVGWIAAKAFKHDPREEWFGLLWDDQCPQSPQWDVQLVSVVQSWSVVTSADAIGGDWRRGAVVWGKACFAVHGADGGDWDSILSAYAAEAPAAKCWFVNAGIHLPRRDGPATARISHQADGAALKACMDRHGVRTIEPDYTGVSLQVAIPSMSSRPEAACFLSVLATMRELGGRGVPVELTMERYNADICMARSHLVAEFLRTRHTHLLMVDDDMTWDVDAVHRLFFAEKDICAVAGPKKSYPLRFAASRADSHDNPIPLEMDTETAVAEVDHVGAAFMLITRNAAERMVKAHPDLRYTGSDGKESWALFLPMIENGRYRAEDFAFCSRWRDIGGRIFIAPDVNLGHIGSHEYKGNLWTAHQAPICDTVSASSLTGEARR